MFRFVSFRLSGRAWRKHASRESRESCFHMLKSARTPVVQSPKVARPAAILEK
jgi:hypothetical protein